jgi:phage gp29-like protein
MRFRNWFKRPLLADFAAEAGKTPGGPQIATRDTDPALMASMRWLPNPDPILRKLGRQQEAWQAIAYDSHVAGELRQMHAGVAALEYRVMPGATDRASRRAHELCEALLWSLSPDPADPTRTWGAVVWEMYVSRLRGTALHEVVWDREDLVGVPGLLPRVIEVPQRRLIFGADGLPRLLTQQEKREGVPMVEPRHWLITRHMAEADNPYGFALFSAIFWPATFKQTGMGWWATFMKRHGIPKGIGKVPPGTPQKEREAIADQLQAMIEDAVAVITNDSSAELLNAVGTTGDLHASFVAQCNAEISKGLRSQTLATEINGQGSRAAAETHRGREQAGDQADRADIAASFNLLFRWISEVNFPGAAAPWLEFFEESEARSEWVEVLAKARDFVQVPVEFAHEVLQIPQSDGAEPVLPASSAPAAGLGTDPPAPVGEFAASARLGAHLPCPHCGGRHDYAAGGAAPLEETLADQLAPAADTAVDGWLQRVKEMGESAGSMAEFRAMIDAGFSELERGRLERHLELAFTASALRGMADVRNEAARG